MSAPINRNLSFRAALFPLDFSTLGELSDDILPPFHDPSLPNDTSEKADKRAPTHRPMYTSFWVFDPLRLLMGGSPQYPLPKHAVVAPDPAGPGIIVCFYDKKEWHHIGSGDEIGGHLKPLYGGQRMSYIRVSLVLDDDGNETGDVQISAHRLYDDACTYTKVMSTDMLKSMGLDVRDSTLRELSNALTIYLWDCMVLRGKEESKAHAK